MTTLTAVVDGVALILEWPLCFACLCEKSDATRREIATAVREVR